MHRNATESIREVQYFSLFAEAYNITAIVGAAIQRFRMCKNYALQKDLTPDERHAACSVFQLLGVQKD